MFRTSLIILEETESTQDVARNMALEGAPSGSAVMAMNQTKGRGRSGSQWVSPPGKNLAISLIVRPNVPVNRASLIGMLTAVCVADTVNHFCGSIKARLKWPNDVLAEGKKISGIISEARFLANTVDFIVVGIGLNVNSTIEDFSNGFRESSTSLFAITGKQVDLRTTAKTLLQEMERLLDRVDKEGTDFILDEWEARWLHKGLNVTRNGVTGAAIALDEDGSLLMELPDGKILKVSSGTISSA